MSAELMIVALFACALSLYACNAFFKWNLLACVLFSASVFVGTLGSISQSLTMNPYETTSLMLLVGLLFIVTSAGYNGAEKDQARIESEEALNPLATVVPSTALMGTRQVAEPDTLTQNAA